MKSVLILYDTQFGNTKQVSLEIAASILTHEGFTAKVERGDNLDIENISGYDAILFGGPTRAFRATRGALNTIKRAAKSGLDEKIVACFGCYMMGDQSRGVKAMDKLVDKVAPNAFHIKPGFSAKVDGVRGPVNERVSSDIPRFAKSIIDEVVHRDMKTAQVNTA